MKEKAIYILLFAYSLLAFFCTFYFDGTGDSGDSVLHYQFARYAPVHKELFFDHWAKPVYVLLASPFAQFGFIGVKIFNLLVSLITVFYTYKIAEKLGLKNAVCAALILLVSPLHFMLTFSGLTEPLFALFLVLGVFAILKERIITASFLLSFLPFIRSEGLIIIGVFAFYLALKHQWKFIPLLLAGHVVYSIAGYFVYHDFLWVFNRIPYARLSSTYGSGKLSHFIVELYYVVGLPVYILFWIGMLFIIWKSFFKQLTPELGILIFGGVFAFILAHTIFWYFGIFNSMGLKRVLLSVAPLISIIALMGFNFLTEVMLENRRIPRLLMKGIWIGYLLVFPFTKNVAAIHFKQDLGLSEEQKVSAKVAAFCLEKFSPKQRYFYAYPYLSELLKIDHFDRKLHLELTGDYQNYIRSGDIIVWENWFAVVEQGLLQQALDANTKLTKIYSAGSVNRGREIKFDVYYVN